MDESTQPMTAREYAPARRLDDAPTGRPYVAPVTREQREQALRDALHGVELGGWDERIVSWMLRTLDDATLRTVVSLLGRARTAGALAALDAEAALQLHQRRLRAGR